MSVIDNIGLRAKPQAHRIGKRPFSLPSRSPFHIILMAGAGLAAALILLAPAYLLIRTASAGQDTLDTLLKVRTWSVLGSTLLLAGSVTLAGIAIAVPLAWLTACTDLPGRRLWAILAALPLVIPSYVAAFIYASILTPKGLLQQQLYPLTGIEKLPNIYGFPGAFLVLTLISYPYILLTTRAAFTRLDPALTEAARSLGVSPWGAFRRVTLPTLRPAIAAGGLLTALYVMRDFGAVTMMQYSTFTRIIYNRYVGYKLTEAAAMALILVGVTAVILLFEQRSRGRAQYARLSIGAARQRQPVKLGFWKIPALFFVGGVVFSSLIVPAAGLLYWFGRGWRQDWGVRDLSAPTTNIASLLNLIQPAGNSLLAALLAALLTMALALPIAILAVRHPGKLSRFFEQTTYASYALPGIVIALALVFFGTNYAGSLYQTLPMLLAAYVILFLPQAVGSERASLLQVSSSLEEAGRSLGKRPFAVFRAITLPLVRPGLLAGGALVFLTAMKELPATLILSPLGFNTLSVQIWGSISEAFFARAAAPTLLLLLLSSVPLALLNLREK
ncbi:MAG: iron ABC transporter permease [Chloroflexota bacterium]